MIKNISITGRKYDVSDQIKEHVGNNIGQLDRFAPKSARRTLHGEVKLSEESKGANKFGAEVILHFKNGQVTAKESAATMEAAIDKVEDKLQAQLTKHHDKHVDHKSNRKGYLTKLRNLADRDFRGRQN